jgi:hypothetical protein
MIFKAVVWPNHKDLKIIEEVRSICQAKSLTLKKVIIFEVSLSTGKGHK